MMLFHHLNDNILISNHINWVYNKINLKMIALPRDKTNLGWNQTKKTNKAVVHVTHAIINIFLFFFWTSLSDPIACSLLGVGVPAQNIGYRGTNLCPSILLGYYRSTPLLQSWPGVSSCAALSPYCASSLSDSASALSFAPSRSSPS